MLPNGATYTPGVKQHLMVMVKDAAQQRWGFELSARLNSDQANGQAGDLASTDGNTQVFCDDGSPKPCASPTVVQFVSHTLAGTQKGTTGGATFEFDWTPPATDAGPVTLYVAGNAANGDGSPVGDHIYTSNIQLSAQVSAPMPAITKDGVVNAATFQASVSPGSWVTIFGSNLATNTRLWTGADIIQGQLPTSLDGTSVMINNKPAYVEFISPGQVNVLMPDDNSTGPVQVLVTSTAGVSSASTVQLQAVAPGFFLFDGKYVAAEHGDGSAIGKPGLFASAPATTTPAKPGEVIALFGTGFGPTTPAPPSGQVVAQTGALVDSLQMTIGGVAANVKFSGLMAGFAGLYQINVEIPATVSDGDQKIVAQIGGASSPDATGCCFVTVQH